MKIRYKKKEFIYTLSAFFLTFYCYNTTFQNKLYGSRRIGVLLVLILVAICIVKTFKFKNNRKVNDILFFWIILTIISTINNQDLQNDSESRWLLPMAGIYSMVALSKKKDWIDAFLRTSKVMILIHSFFTIFFFIFRELYLDYFVQLLPGDHTYIIDKFKDGSMPGITGHYSINGIYLGFGIIFFAVDIFFKKYKNKDEYIYGIVKFLMVFTALIFTTKRAHILFSMAAIFVMYYVYNSNRKISRWFYMLLAVFTIGVIVLIMVPLAPAIANVINRFMYANNGELTNGRIWFWKFALRKFFESPILGIGWGGFKHEYHKVIGTYSSDSEWVDCHCVFLQVLCEQGIIGIICFCIALFGGLKLNWNILSKARKKLIDVSANEINRLTLTLGIQSFFVMYCLTGNCLYDCEALFPYTLACATAFATINKILERNQQNEEGRIANISSSC